MNTFDAAYGNGHESFMWFTVPLYFDVPLELSSHIGSAEGVLAATGQLLLQPAGWLSALQLGAKTYRLTLEHERRRGRNSESAASSTPVRIALVQPACTLAHLSRVLHERVHRLILVIPAAKLYLTVADATPLAPPIESLLPEPGGRTEDATRLINMLIARLDVKNVLHPQLCADHCPEHVNH